MRFVVLPVNIDSQSECIEVKQSQKSSLTDGGSQIMFNAFRKPSRFDFANVLIDIQGGRTRISNAALKHLRNNIYDMLNTNLAQIFRTQPQGLNL
jgi:hypothetical protein